MQLKYLLLFCSSFLIRDVTSVESSISSGISLNPHTALQNEINTQPANPTKKRKRLPDLNKSPPRSETEENSEKMAIETNIGPIGSSGKQIEKTRRKSKYEREREKIRRLPPNEREKVRIYEQGKAKRYRDKLKSRIGVTSRLCLRIKELKALRKTGTSTIQQDLELDKIINHKNKVRNLWRARKKGTK